MKKKRHGRRAAAWGKWLGGLAAGLAIGAVLLVILVSRYMDSAGFVPLNSIMRSAGYTRIPSEDPGLWYANDEKDILLRIEEDFRTVKKEDFVFDGTDAFTRALKRIYVKQDFIQNLLGVTVSRLFPFGFRAMEMDAVTAAALTELDVPFIAHAGGGEILQEEDGTYYLESYTNSLESICRSYGKGFRAVEVDLILSEDGILCAVHNWKTDYGLKLSSQELLQTSAPDGGTTLLLEDVLRLFKQNKDMILVLDIKSYEWSREKLVRQYSTIAQAALEIGGEELADRIVPQLCQFGEYEPVKSIYEWKNLILTMYRMNDVADEEILSWLTDKPDVRIVTCKTTRATEEFARSLHELGRQLWVYTCNDVDGVYSFLNMGVDGFYTDLMTPATWLERYGDHGS